MLWTYFVFYINKSAFNLKVHNILGSVRKNTLSHILLSPKITKYKVAKFIILTTETAALLTLIEGTIVHSLSQRPQV